MNLGIDVETTKLPFIHPWQAEAALVCVSVCDEEGKRKTWFLTDDSKTPREIAHEISSYIKSYKRLVAHNLSFDLQWLDTLGVDTSNHLLYCTMVAEYLIQGQQRQQGLSLNDLCDVYQIPKKKDKVKVYWDAGIDTPDIDRDVVKTYCEQDAANAIMIFQRQIDPIIYLNMVPLLSLEMEALRVFSEMGREGMRVSEQRLTEYQEDYTAKLEQMDKRLSELLGIPNVGSSQQLSAGLFGGVLKHTRVEQQVDDYGQPVKFQSGQKKGQIKTKKVEIEEQIPGIGFPTKGITETARPGIFSTSVDELKKLKPKTKEQKEVATLLLERSRISQLKSTYFDGLLDKMVDGYVHPSINQALTRTGRLSCSAPNLQNVPRDNTGPVKQCFISRYGDDPF